MRTLKLWGAALAATLALAACGREDAAAPGEEAQAIEIYEVPPAQLQSVHTALLEVLRANETGAVSSSGGKLVVLAPTGTQKSIGRAIQTLSQRPAEAGSTNGAPLRLRFWLVAGSTGNQAQDPRLEPLRPALAEASRTLGLGGFTLLGSTDVLVSPGRRFTSQSGSLIVDGAAALTAAGIEIVVDIEMRQAGASDGRMATDVVLAPGQFLVLGTTDGADGDMHLIVAQAELAAGGP